MAPRAATRNQSIQPQRESLMVAWECPECRMLFDTSAQLVDHQQSNEHWAATLENCGRVFVSDKDFKERSSCAAKLSLEATPVQDHPTSDGVRGPAVFDMCLRGKPAEDEDASCNTGLVASTLNQGASSPHSGIRQADAADQPAANSAADAVTRTEAFEIFALDTGFDLPVRSEPRMPPELQVHPEANARPAPYMGPYPNPKETPDAGVMPPSKVNVPCPCGTPISWADRVRLGSPSPPPSATIRGRGPPTADPRSLPAKSCLLQSAHNQPGGGAGNPKGEATVSSTTGMDARLGKGKLSHPSQGSSNAGQRGEAPSGKSTHQEHQVSQNSKGGGKSSPSQSGGSGGQGSRGSKGVGKMSPSESSIPAGQGAKGAKGPRRRSPRARNRSPRPPGGEGGGPSAAPAAPLPSETASRQPRIPGYRQ